MQPDIKVGDIYEHQINEAKVKKVIVTYIDGNWIYYRDINEPKTEHRASHKDMNAFLKYYTLQSKSDIKVGDIYVHTRQPNTEVTVTKVENAGTLGELIHFREFGDVYFSECMYSYMFKEYYKLIKSQETKMSFKIKTEKTVKHTFTLNQDELNMLYYELDKLLLSVKKYPTLYQFRSQLKDLADDSASELTGTVD